MTEVEVIGGGTQSASKSRSRACGCPREHSLENVILADEMMPERRRRVQPGKDQDQIGAETVQLLDEPGRRTIRRKRSDGIVNKPKKLKASPRNHVRKMPRTGIATSNA